MEEVLTIAISEDYDLVECFNFKPGHIAGYKFTFKELVKLEMWFIEMAVLDGTMVLDENRLANACYDGGKLHIENWRIECGNGSELFEFVDPWVDDPYGEPGWFDEGDFVSEVIRCFKNTDNIVFNVQPNINIYEYDE